jgi:hypothetical protein
MIASAAMQLIAVRAKNFYAGAGAAHEEHEEHVRQVSRIVPEYHATTCGLFRGTQSQISLFGLRIFRPPDFFFR